jgi:ribosome-associated heat shock protein Hsp15
MTDIEMEHDDQQIRLDKWLWAARFFKTRVLAAEAVNGGKVAVNGNRAKPGRSLKIGDQLIIRRGPFEWMVVVKGLARQRGPAPQAQLLYEESEQSARQRETLAAQLKYERAPEFEGSGRPSKKDRRALTRFTRRGW